MAATISDFFKQGILQDIYASYLNEGKAPNTDSDRFYLGIGRAEEWDSTPTTSELVPPNPNPSANEALKFQESLQSLKLITDVSYVVPRYNWTSGNFYSSWDNEYSSNTTIGPSGDILHPYYVITDNNSVFVCLKQGKDPATGLAVGSTQKPTNTTGRPFSNQEDGYIWKFLYTIGALEARKFLTSAYMPVEKFLADSEGDTRYVNATTARQNQWQVQERAVRGEVLGIVLDSVGTGYTSVPTVTITGIPTRGRGSGISELDASNSPRALARVVNGSVYEVVMKDPITGETDSDVYYFGSEHYNASVKFTGGGVTAAQAATGRVVCVTGDSGMGGNPVINLNASALMFHTTLTGVENADFNVRNDFRQVGIIKNPLRDSCELADFPSLLEDSALASSTAQCYKQLFLSGVTGAANFDGDQYIQQDNTLATAILDYYDATRNVAYCHQTRATGFVGFNGTDQVRFYEGNPSEGGTEVGDGTIVANPRAVSPKFHPHLRPAEADRFSGEVIYIDNRVKIVRDDEQTEDIKIVIDL